MIVLAFLLCTLGFACFSLVNKKHFSLVFASDSASRNQRLYLWSAGAALMLVALVLCINSWQAEIGVTVWVGFLQLASLTVAAMLSYWKAGYRLLSRVLLPTA